LAGAGHEVRVIGLSMADDPVPECDTDGDVLVSRVKIGRTPGAWMLGRYQLYRSISDWANRGFIDIVETPDYEGAVGGWPALRVPVVARLHGSSSYFAVEMGGRPDKLTFLLERASLRRANFICSTSRYTAERTKRLFQLRGPDAVVVHNATAVSNGQSGNRVSGRVVFSGTLAEKKGVISLIRAWGKVAKECPEARLEMFGKAGRIDKGGSMEEYLISCLAPEIRETVHFRGHVDLSELRSAFRSATVAVFPSYAEAFALAPMEAMAEGCPTIYTRRGSGPELIEHGKDGLLVDPGHVDEIADAILSVLKQPKMASALGVAGRQRIEECFSPSKFVSRNIDFYTECVESHNPSRWKASNGVVNAIQ
jgi:glycosyltransferase involved in cell wall biosynthesis